MNTLTAEQHREKAAQAEQSAADSWERSDTDGFVSQWASGLTADLHRLDATILDQGGTSDFAGLFNAKGERIKAKLVSVTDRYRGFGKAKRSLWLVLDANDNAIVWVPRQYATRVDGKTGDIVSATPNPRSKMFKLGLHEASEQAPAKAKIFASGTGLSGAASARVGAERTDKGYPEGAVVFER